MFVIIKMSKSSKNLSTNLDQLYDIFNQCIKINNEYKLKHGELTEIYNAYKILVANCDSKTIQKHLYSILSELEYKFISKENLNELLVDQTNIMNEVNNINLAIKKLYPNY